MTRAFKIMGTTLAAALALSAVVASTASAVNHHFNGTVGDQLLTEATTLQVYKPTTGGDESYICKKLSVEGEVESATATSEAVAPSWEGCYTPVGGSQTAVYIAENECHVNFTGVTTAGNPTDGEHAGVHLECPEGHSMETRLTVLKLKCFAVGPQAVAHAVVYIDDENGHIDIHGTAHGIVSVTQGVCGEGEHTNGSYTGSVTLFAPHALSLSET